MNFTKRLRALAAFVPALLPVTIILATACSNGHERREALDRSATPIIGGVADSTHTWAVGISIGSGAICSGTLIAPNLVLTARHCVSQTTEQIDCRPDAGLNANKVFGDYPATSFRVYPGATIGSGTAYSVDYVRKPDAPEANRVCGYDLALLELRKPTAGYPTVHKAPSFEVPRRRGYTAIGYGCQTAEGVNGGGCDPRGQRMLLDPVNIVQVDAQDFVIQGRVCGGDSGGPVWNQSSDRILGALSRGDGTTAEAEGCNYGIYTRTDVHREWLQKYGKLAAQNGGYAPLAWMSEIPAAVDAGTDTAPPAKKDLGETCVAPTDCASGVCADFGGGKQLCTKECGSCPAEFTCTQGFCAPGSSEADAAVEDAAPVTPASDTVPASSCHVGNSTPPPRPQPWIVASVVGLALALVRRRR